MIQRASLGRRAALVALAFMITWAAGVSLAMIVDPPQARAAPGDQRSQGKAAPPASGGTSTTESPQAQQPEVDSGTCGPFGPACDAANEFRTPGTALVGGLSGLGLLVGGALVGVGQQTGVRIMGISAAAGGGLMIGNGVISVLT